MYNIIYTTFKEYLPSHQMPSTIMKQYKCVIMPFSILTLMIYSRNKLYFICFAHSKWAIFGLFISILAIYQVTSSPSKYLNKHTFYFFFFIQRCTMRSISKWYKFSIGLRPFCLFHSMTKEKLRNILSILWIENLFVFYGWNKNVSRISLLSTLDVWNE